jgi:flavorubredoxin
MPNLKPKSFVKNENNQTIQIVDIVASVGVLEALEQFFENIPAKSGTAFIIIQHLNPTHKGIVMELLRQITEIRVYGHQQAQNFTKLVVHHSSEQKQISILKNLPPHSIAITDKEMISTILRKLISNEIKFTNTGRKIVILAKQKQSE